MSFELSAVLVISVYLTVEAVLFVTVKGLRRDFPWLIMRNDILPQVPKALAKTHAARSLDPDLGWVRRPGEQGSDETERGLIFYNIDQRGRRRQENPLSETSKISVFGDSFAFCRLVSDDETWPHYMGQLTNSYVENWGVGNYGFDQSLLRLERHIQELDSSVVVLAFVPESIARVRSYWKHYFEYGNILAFKPVFELLNGDLKLHQSAVRIEDDYATYSSKIREIQRLDYFYSKKFCSDLLAFPFLPKILIRANRHGAIIFHLLSGFVSGDRIGARRRAFNVVLRENSLWTKRLYHDQGSLDLMRALIIRFNEICEKNAKKPALVVLPQPTDIDGGSNQACIEFYKEMQSICPILDMTETFIQHQGQSKLYVGGALGPHPNPEGNKLIAKTVIKFLREREYIPDDK